MAKPAATNVPTTATAGCWMDASLGAEVENGVADGIPMEDDMEGIADDHEDHEDQADEAVESTKKNVELDITGFWHVLQDIPLEKITYSWASSSQKTRKRM